MRSRTCERILRRQIQLLRSLEGEDGRSLLESSNRTLGWIPSTSESFK